jgi:hypothetical protein
MKSLPVLLFAFTSWAGVSDQAPADQSTAAPASAAPSSNVSPAVIKIGDVTFSGSLRARLYVWDWFDAPPGQNQYAYSGNVLRFGFSEKRGGFDWNAEFEVPFLLGLPTNATQAAPQGALGLGSNYYSANDNQQYAAMIFPKQLFARFRGIGGVEGQSLQIGRFVFQDGTELTPKNATLAYLKQNRVAQRLLGDFGFSDVGRSFDGVHYAYTKPSDDFTFAAAIPTRGVFQVDGWGWNRVGFGYAAYTHESGKGKHLADTRVFVIEYDDWRHILKTDNRALAVRRTDTENIRIETYGAHSIHSFVTNAGTIDAVAWGAGQTGRWGTQRHRAYAIDLEAGFQPAWLPSLRPWFRAGFTGSSGDGNPNDNTHGTFFQILPTPRPYARMPFFNMMNLQDGWGGMILRPSAKVTVTSEFHSLRLANANDLWYSGGGAYQPWSFGYTGRSTSGRRSLGNLFDTSVDYRVSRALTLTAYLGVAQGLASIEKIYPAGTTAKFGYLELLHRF